ncbi:DUF397 domain-containing protein [Nocardia crassostreae]|uniref:DUF397 domain-containing protein n=1 Tax=Nocardia crassostreae TaxID=53428 RepID=UPI000836FFD6|nr:DUF397 domain-containing protein [Nocardia crassostreae]
MNVDLSAAKWFKSSRSGGSKECVEVAFIPGAVGVRDSKDRSGPALILAPGIWDDFMAGLNAGRFD